MRTLFRIGLPVSAMAMALSGLATAQSATAFDGPYGNARAEAGNPTCTYSMTWRRK